LRCDSDANDDEEEQQEEAISYTNTPSFAARVANQSVQISQY